MSPEAKRPDVALVTGGTSGIGRATALAFARSGCSVVLTGRRRREGEEVADEIRAFGGEAAFVQADQRDAASRDSVIDTVRRLGSLRSAFNNAGTAGSPAPMVEFEDSDYVEVFDTNVRSVLRDLRWQVGLLREAGGGAIVNNSSIAAHVGMPGLTVYSASKGALDAITRSVAAEVAEFGIRVNAVAPGGVQTPGFERAFGHDERRMAEFASRHPIGRVGTPEEIAELVVWLASDATFVTGQVVVADGGYSVV